MKKLKPHHHLALVSMVIFGVVSIWAWGTMVFASSSATTINLYLGPPDTCPNIPGYQMTLPDGMQVDGDGNCYTPPPPPIDMCTNMDGMQETIPAGYYRSGTECLPQPATPNDVCPNLTGIQDAVPSGYINTIDGRCVRPPADMCTNVTGTQVLVPDTLERTDSGVCFTPSPTSPTQPPDETPAPDDPWASPTKPRQDPAVMGEADLKNVPSLFEPLLRPFVDAVPDTAKEALRSLPPIVARTFPYFTFSILAIASAIMSWQSVREAITARKIAAFTRREYSIATEKDSFIRLVTHYLITPARQMEEIVIAGTSAPKPFTVALQRLRKEIETIASQAETGVTLNSSAEPPSRTRFLHLSFLTSAFFWVPVVVTLLIAWVANFLLGVVGNVEIGTFNMIAQAGVYVAASLFFYSSIRTHYLKQREHTFREQELEHEEALDHARNEFISTSAQVLTARLEELNKQRVSLSSDAAEKRFINSHTHFTNLVERLKLLASIEIGTTGAMEKFNLKSSVDTLVALYQPALQAKELTIINDTKPSRVKQRPSLFEFVLGSLLDDVIDFSAPGDIITIGSSSIDHDLTVHVTNRHHASNEAKNLHFDYASSGLGLFLDRIIMDYVGRASRPR